MMVIFFYGLHKTHKRVFFRVAHPANNGILANKLIRFKSYPDTNLAGFYKKNGPCLVAEAVGIKLSSAFI